MQSSSQIAPQAQPCRSRPHLARGVKVLVGQRALQLAVHLQLEQEQHHLWMEKWRGTGVMRDCTTSRDPQHHLLRTSVWSSSSVGVGGKGREKREARSTADLRRQRDVKGSWEVFIRV